MKENGSDSDVSDADPDAILKSMQNIDDLDAELFGARSSKTSKSSGKTDKKHVSFSNAINEKEIPVKSESSSTSDFGRSKPGKKEKSLADIDFDLDDPLAGILSSDEDDGFPTEVKVPSKPTNQAQSGKLPVSKSAPISKPKKSVVTDDLFADDDDDRFLLDNTPPVARKQIRKESAGSKMSVKALLENASDDALPTSGVTKRRTLDDFLQSPIKTTASAPQKKASNIAPSPDKFTNDNVAFGGYQPSLSGSDNLGGNKRQPRQRASLSAFKFEDDRSAKSTTSSEQTTPEITNKQQNEAFDFLSPTVVNTRRSSLPRTTPPLATKRQKSASPSMSPFISSDAATTKPIQDDNFELIESRTQAAIDLDFDSDLGKQSSVPTNTTRPQTAPPHTNTSQLPFAGSNTIESWQQQPAPLTRQPQNRVTAHSYTSDTNALQLAQENRIETLRRALDDMQSRMSSEVESIKESYEARFQMLRASMREAVQVETNSEVSKQDEIKRLRSLHIDALNDSRADYDAQVKSLREAHKNEVEAVKNATVHARNIDTMMSKLDDTTKHLQQLALKYESAYFAITQQTESLSTGNQQAVAAMLKELHQQHKATNEAQLNLQQNAARLEGVVTSLSKKLEEQHYQIQATQSQLQLTHTSLQDDRSQMLQQMNKEREHNRKTQRDIVDLQEQFQHSMKESLSQILRHSENLKLSFNRLEEERSQQVQAATKRSREVDDMHERLLVERLELSKKQAEVEATSIHIRAEKEELHDRLISVENEKNSLQTVRNELTRREQEAMHQHQRALKVGMESEHAITEARQIQDSHDSKLAALHAERNEIAKQRQMLAEERRLLSKERLNFNHEHPQQLQTTSMKQTQPTITRTTNRTQPNNTTPTDVLLWKHTAVQDYGYLETEKVFVESLRQSPFRKTS